MNGFFLGTTRLQGKNYGYNDITGMMSPQKFGMTNDTYGGRVKSLGKTKTQGIYLVVEKNDVIDIYVDDPEDLTVKVLTELAHKKGLEVPKNATKADLLKLLGYKA